MSVQDIINIVSTVGFPIVCCAACFWYINKTGTEHKQEMDKMSEAINNNTIIMQKLLTHLEDQQ